jgi:PAT family acetyl-CoA transporter-like MFS transporter 1
LVFLTKITVSSHSEVCYRYKYPNHLVFTIAHDITSQCTIVVFLYIYGSIFIVTAILVAIFKYENKQLAYKRMSTLETYKTIWRIIKIKPIQLLMFFLVSFKLGYAEKGIPILKIIRNGFSKDIVSLFMYTPLTPVNILWPIVISKFTSGVKPLKVFFLAYPIRLVDN